MAHGGKIDLRSLLQIAKRWKWLLIVPPILALIGAYVYVATTPPQYTSTTTISFGTNQSLTPELVGITPGVQVQSRVRIVEMWENIKQQFLSENLLNKVVERCSLKISQGTLENAREIMRNNPRSNEKEVIRKLQIDWLAEKVEAGIVFPKRGMFVQLNITHTDPYLAYLLAKTLAETFIEESLQLEKFGPEETIELAKQQLAIYELQLDEAREQLRQFQTGLVREKTKIPEVNLQNESVLEGLLQSHRQSLKQQPSQDLRLAQLQRRVNELDDMVSKFREQVRGAELRVALRNSDAEVRYKISDPPNLPIMPTNSENAKAFLMALFGGLGFGLGLVYLIEFFDHSFKTVDEIEQFLGVTVLGTVPKLDFGEK